MNLGGAGKGRTSRMEGSLKTRSRMAEDMKGVWLPVPKKRATRGYTITSPNFLSKRNRESMFSTEIRAKTTRTWGVSGCSGSAVLA